MTRRRLLLGAAALWPMAARARTVLAATPIARLDLRWWRERHAAKLAQVRAEKFELVWLGDSITQRFEDATHAPVWERYYGGRRALNLGFSGDTTASVLWRLAHGELGGQAPRCVVLLIGANNLGRVHWSAEDTGAGIEAILDELRRRVPGARIVLLGVLPRGGDAWTRETQAAINRTLAAGAGRREGVTYFDPSPLFRRADGGIDDALYDDPAQSPPELPLHPSAAGMERVARLIEPAVAAALGDRARA